MNKNFRPIALVLIVHVVFPVTSNAQSGNPNPNPSLNNVTPPSPNAASLGKFGDIPVGHFTGVPQINVPIYSYQNAYKSLSLSVSLDYHAGGIKVDEVASNVGIGWALNTGGVITRTRRGLSDEMPQRGFMHTPVYLNESEGNRYATSQYILINANQIDGQSDIFNFSLGGERGKFMYGKNGDFLMLSPSKLKVEKEIGNVGAASLSSCIKKFVITDEMGRKYVFEELELTNCYDPLEMMFVSSWYLTEIRAPFATESITFQYESENYGYAITRSQSETVSLDPNTFPSAPVSTSTPYSTIAGKRIRKVVFPDATEINYAYDATLRTDLGPFGDPGNLSRLKKIVISNGNHSRGFNLYHSYLLNRLTLTSVLPFSAGGETAGYTFDYNLNSGSWPLPDRISGEQDHWGFYNSNTSTNTFPAQNLSSQYGTSNANLYGGTREVDTERVKCGSLSKITYPTGGFTLFEFEAHKVSNVGLPSQYVGGLRIKTIKNYSNGSAASTIKEYTYVKEDGTTSSGHIGFYPEYSYGVFYDQIPSCHPPLVALDYRFYSNNGGIPNAIVRVSSPVQTLSLTNGSPANYSRVVEKTVSGTDFTGSTIRYYDSYEAAPPSSQTAFPYTPPAYTECNYGQLKQELFYNKNGNLLKKTVNEYLVTQDFYYYTPGRLENFESITLLPVKYQWEDNTCDGVSGNEHLSFQWGSVVRPVYFISNKFTPFAGRKDLVKTTTTEYANGQALVSETEYTYDQNFNVKTTTTKNSRYEQLERVNYYPYNYTGSALAVSMINDHNLYSLPLSTEVWKTIGVNKYLTGGSVTQYQQQPNGIRRTSIEAFRSIAPLLSSNVPAFNTASFNRAPTVFEEAVRFNAYDTKGNLLEQQKTSDVKHSYLWGYNKTYLVAEVIGADYTTVSSLVDQSVLDNPQGTDAQVKAQLTNLRNGLAAAKALVTTYTYKLLVGMTSQTDPRGRTTYYEYDSFGRLFLIRDHNQKIVKKICYNYAGQPEACPN